MKEFIEYKRMSRVGEAEHRWMRSERSEGRGLVLDRFNGKKKNFVRKTGFIRKPVWSTKDQR